MNLDAIWSPLIKPSKAISEQANKDYLITMKENFRRFQKNPKAYIDEISNSEQQLFTDTIMSLSLPRRKRFNGLVPIGLEIGLFNATPRLHGAIYEELCDQEKSLANLCQEVAYHPETQEFVSRVTSDMPLISSNLGVLSHAFFHSRFELLGSPIFSLDDSLYRELCLTDIGKQTPCEFMRMPAPNFYLEFGKARLLDNPRCYNEESGWHVLEGAYLNQYILSEQEMESECINPEIDLANIKKERNKFNIISHALATGHIKRGGGDVDVIEIMTTGSPLGKSGLCDDATHQFILLIQDREMDVEALIDWHIKFNNRELSTQRNLQHQVVDKDLPLRHKHRLGAEEEQTIRDAVIAIAKALLYINSETCSMTNVNEATEHKATLRRTKNKAKLRKLEKRGKLLSDHILLTVPKDANDITSQGEKKAGGKATHWRRAHFHPFRYGEGRKKVRIKWIPRTLINAKKGLAKPQVYDVK